MVKEFNYYNIIVHLNYFFAVGVAGSMISFALHFPNENNYFSLKKELLLQLSIILIALFSFSEIVVKVKDIRMFDTSNPAGYLIYFLVLAIYFILIPAYIFIKKIKNSTGILQIQLKYITVWFFISIIILLIQSLLTNIKGVLPVHIDFIYTNILIVFSLITSYAMLRYRFMDIKVVIRKSLIYGFSLIITLAFYTYIVLIFKSSIEKYWDVNTTWTAIILIVLVALGFPLLKSLIEKAVDIVFKGKKSIDLAVKELRKQISQKRDLDALIDVIGDEVKKYLSIEQVKFFVLNHKDNSFEWREDGMNERIQMHNDLVRYFEKYPQALVREEISYQISETEGKFDQEILQKAEKEMKKRQATLALPYKTEEGVYAILFLGKRQGDKPYSVHDIEYLEQMREQVNFTLASIVLYREAMERIRLQTGQAI